MNDTIRVGDKVETLRSHRTGWVQGIYGDKAWILLDSDELETLYLSVLTRIEPESGTLSLGQVVRRKRDADRTGVVTGLEARIRWGDCLFENVPIELLEPVPEPCPACGKE